MTFHEAGLQILETAGHPLSYQEITAQAIQQGLLSHVGQIPEQTMRQRLAALARRSRNRRVAVVGPDQFALTDWGLPEDTAALTQLEAPETPDEGPARRGTERHPPITPPRGGRSEGRGDGKDAFGRRRRKRLPPLSEVAFEILSEAHKSLSLEEILARARERELVGEELGADTLSSAIAEENRRRAEAGRRAAFVVSESGQVEIIEGPAETSDRDGEGSAGRRQPPTRLAQQAVESRRNATRLIRRRVAELDSGSLERIAAQLLERSGYRDCRAVKRAGREGSLLTARRKLGLTEFRFAIRLAPNGLDVGREEIRELRREMVAHGAHAGMVLGPGDVGREGRAEALLVGQPLVTLLCGDALADELVLRQVGIQLIEVVQIDDFFWKTLRRSPAVPSSEPVAALAVPATAPSASPPAPSPSSSGVESSGIVAEWAVPIQLTQAISPAAEAGEAPVEAPEADGDGERPGIARVPGEGQ
jgi:restriction endonuclease Mrr